MRFGQELVAQPSPQKEDADLIFAILLVSMLCIFGLGNLVVRDGEAIESSAAVGAGSVAVVLAWYGLWAFLRHITWSLAGVFAILGAVAYDRTGVGIALFCAVSVVGLVLALKQLRVPRRTGGPIVLVGILWAIIVVGADGVYTSFDITNRAHAGQVHLDALFHSSIAAMIKNYGVASTGLHGLVDLNYHTFSHAMVAALSKVSGQGVLETYGAAQSMLFIPLMMASILLGTTALARSEAVNVVFISAVLAVVLSLLPLAFKRWGFWNSFLVSESYAVAIAMFSLGLLLLYKERLTYADIALALVVTGMLTVTKVSVGAIYCGLWGVRFLLLRRGWATTSLVTAVSSAAIFLLVNDVWSSPSGSDGGLHFLHFIEKTAWLGGHIPSILLGSESFSRLAIVQALIGIFALMLFMALHFFPAWVAVVLCSRGTLSFRAVRLPAVAYILGSVVAGVLFFNLALPAGAAYYFSNVSFFVALPVLLLGVSCWPSAQPKGNAVPLVAGGMLLTATVLTAVISVGNIRHGIPQDAHGPRNVLVKRLIEIREQSGADVVISVDEGLIQANPFKECTAAPFAYPAVSERPWVGVIDLEGSCVYKWYGYEAYNVGPKQLRSLPAPVLRGYPIVPAASVGK